MTGPFTSAAVDVAERGYYVFPARARGKTPRTENGWKDATRDEREILHWAERYPDANIGVACGPSGIVALDIDSKHGADPDAVLAELDIDGAHISRTGVAPAPSEGLPDSLPGVRGAHVLWRGDMPTTGRLRIPGTEIRGRGAYILVAPSVHPSGVTYEGAPPPLDRLPEAPPWLADLVVGDKRGPAPSVDAEIRQGERHAELLSIAGTMRRRGLGETEILATLRAVNAERCRPPLPDDELLRLTRDAGKWAPGRPKRDPGELSDLTIPDWLTQQLADAGVSDEEIEGAGSLQDLMRLLGGKETAAARIVRHVLEAGVELFHDVDDTAFATVTIDRHAETWPVRSRQFGLYVRRLMHKREDDGAAGEAVTTNALSDAVATLEARALFDGEVTPVHTRIAGDTLRVVIDLGDPEWRAIEITRHGWRVLDHHPVKFRRTGAQLPLPMPVAGGSLDDLRGLMNVDDDGAWKLVVGWLLAALRPGYPFPVLVLHGEQGSAKTTVCRMLRALVDPNASPVRAAPHDIDDLMVSATRSWVVAYDNISHLPRGLSDAICRLATGGGLSKRALYSNDDEIILDALRPVVLNGIDAVAKSSDLLDRALLVELPVIDEDDRMPEEELWARFEQARAGVFGALCTAAAGALARVHDVRLERLPRMADFARWVTAAEPAFGWEPGAFVDVYGENRGESHEVALESSTIGPALRAVADGGFHGTASELLEALGEEAGDAATRRKDWPNPRALVDELKRLAPNMRALGYLVEQGRKEHGGTRKWTIEASR
jgi:hypothetical protein